MPMARHLRVTVDRFGVYRDSPDRRQDRARVLLPACKRRTLGASPCAWRRDPRIWLSTFQSINRYNPAVWRPVLHPLPRRPGLLVSVRNDAEAADALRADADVIDVKAPERGPLGRADAAVVARVVQRIADRRPVTAAAGDWGEMSSEALVRWALEGDARVIKLGLTEWLPPRAIAQVKQIRTLLPSISLGPVLYADRITAGSVTDSTLGQHAVAFGGGWLVIDTFDKQRGDLFDAWPQEEVSRILDAARRFGQRIVLAGGLRDGSLSLASGLGADLLGVRGAVCVSGRASAVSAQKVALVLRQLMSTSALDEFAEKNLTQVSQFR